MRKDPTTVSATIYMFPDRMRRDKQGRLPDERTAILPQDIPVVCVDAWYHQEALQEAVLRKPTLRLV